MKTTGSVILRGLNLFGVFGVFLLLGFISTFIYSPVILSHADSNQAPVDVRIGVRPVISISTNIDELELNAYINTFASGAVDVDVATNSQYGYTLTLEDADDSSNMVSTTTGVTDYLSSDFSGSKTSSTMDDNTWGYSIDNTDFYKIPTKGNLVYLTNTSSATSSDPGYDRTPVYFGAKVGMITSGDYVDTVKFTAYVNGQDGEPILPTPMQSFGCDSLTNIGDTAYVIDTRDDNTYWVKKLIDGQCWMIDNLRIQDKELTDADSDLESGTTYTLPASDISKFTGTWGVNIDAVYLDDEFGGYYTFYTATAGTKGMHSVFYDAPSSICPKGWRLPTGNTNGDFNRLYSEFYHYGQPSKMMNDARYTLSGHVNEGQVKNRGSAGFYWTGTVSGGSSAYFLGISPDNISFGVYNIYFGSSVRCIARS